jgi:hypothetical protein
MIFYDFFEVFKQAGCSSSCTMTMTSGNNVNDGRHDVANGCSWPAGSLDV